MPFGKSELKLPTCGRAEGCVYEYQHVLKYTKVRGLNNLYGIKYEH